ncbi:hypothetical protein LCGC14_2025620 [marine sediment metagenome]|uniref:DUF4406 domain-containing protein n=1 Tax=marine sediment metagenome TaxID=412755 RepID=A0A0F9EWD8_9ZZZZ
MKRACYLAGPMRPVPKFNYPAFNAAAKQLREAGWVVFNPAEMDIALDDDGPDLTLSVEKQEEHAEDWANARRYAHRDTVLIIQKLRAERGDAIVTLPEWSDSIGARAEVSVALWVGLAHMSVSEAVAELSR